jgi:hypothetical protein
MIFISFQIQNDVEGKVFECLPIFKVLLVVGVDFISIYRSWATFVIIKLSLLYTVLVKHVGDVRAMNLATFGLYSYVCLIVISK